MVVCFRTLCALALLLLFAAVSPATGAELVVVAASLSSNVPTDAAVAPGTPCADSLKSLKALGFRIADVQGGPTLTYTMIKESLRPSVSPIVAVVFCGFPLPEEPPGPSS